MFFSAQYDEYNNTIESITNIFELDIDETQEEKQSSIDLDLKDLKM